MNVNVSVIFQERDKITTMSIVIFSNCNYTILEMYMHVSWECSNTVQEHWNGLLDKHIFLFFLLHFYLELHWLSKGYFAITRQCMRVVHM